jgi:hypothetical protein
MMASRNTPYDYKKNNQEKVMLKASFLSLAIVFVSKKDSCGMTLAGGGFSFPSVYEVQ